MYRCSGCMMSDQGIKLWLAKNLPYRELGKLGIHTGFEYVEMDNLILLHPRDVQNLMCLFVEKYYAKHQNWSSLETALREADNNLLADELHHRYTSLALGAGNAW